MALNLTFNRVLQASFQPIKEVPTITSSTSSTTPALLVTDSQADPSASARRIRFVNEDSTITQGILFAARGAALSGTIANSMKVLPLSTVEFDISTSMRVGVVAASGTPAYNVITSDFNG